MSHPLFSEQEVMPVKMGVKEEVCSGCRVCEVSCSLSIFRENNPKKSAVRIRGHFPVPGRYQIFSCNQCGTCAEVCPVEAIHEKGGIYIIDPDECTGCGVCVEECPQDAMFMHKDSHVPIKCTLCGTCLAYCPTGALFDEDKA
jgi:ferredoxin